MIRVTVEIVPGGNGPARAIQHVEIVNATGVETQYADYLVRTGERVVRVRHHDRNRPVIELVRAALSALITKEKRRARAESTQAESL